MAEIDHVGEQEYFAPFVRIEGKRGTVLLFLTGEEQGRPGWEVSTATRDELVLAGQIASLVDEEPRR